MREIKFRGKCIPEFPHPVAKWVYGSFVSDKLILSPYKERNEKRNFWYEVDPDTVGQFTGLRDSDGREIYEGDIIKLDDEVYAVTWDNYSGCWSVEFGDMGLALLTQYSTKNSTIIGNSHDNPELLERKP